MANQWLIAITFLIACGTTYADEKRTPHVEPTQLDLTKPLTEMACVETTSSPPRESAWGKLVAIMTARRQMIAASGDKLSVGSARPEIMFTVANNFSGTEGYMITSVASKTDRAGSKGFCIIPLQNSVVIDISKLDQVPSIVNKGELGVALTNNHILGSKVAIMGMYSQGSIFALHFNKDTHIAAYKESDGQGGRARDAMVLENFDYSPKMKLVMEQLPRAKTER